MGVRLDRYKEKKEKKHNRLYGFLKTIIIIIIFIGFGIGILYVNKTIKDLNYLENTILFNINLNDKIITLFGRSYIIEFEKILSFIKPE